MTDMSDDHQVTLRELFEVQLASIHKDIATLTTTIKETAEAHAKAHDRDHEQTSLATGKAERELTLRLDVTKAEAGRANEERRLQIQNIETQIAAQSALWSNLQGRIAGVGIVLTVMTLISGFLALWAALT